MSTMVTRTRESLKIQQSKRGKEICVYEYVYEYGEESPMNLTILSEKPFSDEV